MPSEPDTTDLQFQRRAHHLLVEALEVAVETRRDWVVSRAGDDHALAAEVLALLVAEDDLGDFLDRPAVIDLRLLPDAADTGQERESELPLPASIGPYAIIERLGSGGMGEVYRARQEQPVRREVALKRIRANLPPDARERFGIEQGALARLGHSNVSRFFDAGTTEDGQPYFVMELVAGSPITSYCDDHRLSVIERLQLFLRVCAGVEHAHRQQILHRDLKPSNVLVVEESGKAIPKVIDFGIAKSLDRAEARLALETGTQILGTPVYMSPEALDPQRIDGGIDTRTDVYSLGVLLYELLSGRVPFERGDSGLIALIARIGSGNTQTPSQRFSTLSRDEATETAERRGTEIADVVRQLRGDLDWIVGKAMAIERDDRYGSVGEFAADIRRYLSNMPVEARASGAGYRFRLFARRHRVGMITSGVALLGLVLGVAGLGYGLLKARSETAAAQQALGESRAISDFLIGLFDGSRPGSKPADQVSAADLLDRGADELGTALGDHPAARGRFLRAIGDVYVQIGHYDQAERIFAQAQTVLDATSPADDPQHRALLRSRGVLAYHRSQWKDAEALLREGTQGLDPNTDPETWALAVHDLGVTLYQQGRLDEAMVELQRAYEVRKRTLPPDHPHLVRSRNAIASIYLARGDAAMAAEMFEQSLAQRRATLGPNHAFVAMSLKNLALAHEKLGRWADAESELQQAVDIQQAALGPDNGELAGTLATLGKVLQDHGAFARAEAPMRRALEIRRAALGEDSPVTSGQMMSLGRVLIRLGRLDEAERLMRENLAIRRRLKAKESSLEFPIMYLGLIALERGHLDESEKTLGHSLELWERTLGPDDRSVSWPLLGLARIHLARGEMDEAEKLSKRALDIRMKAYAEGNVLIDEARRIHDQASKGRPGHS